MDERVIRVYADTSVFGGVFDEPFAASSREFVEQARSGRFLLVTSAIVQEEIEPGPEPVRDLFDGLLPSMEIVEVTSEALDLRQAYIEAGIVSARWAADALHVALAATGRCSSIVSWNFRHIVHYRKIPLYNAVNTLRGYPALAIHAPQEIIDYEDQDA